MMMIVRKYGPPLHVQHATRDSWTIDNGEVRLVDRHGWRELYDGQVRGVRDRGGMDIVFQRDGIGHQEYWTCVPCVVGVMTVIH